MTTVSIPLTRGKVALIDEEDLPLVSGYSWRAQHIGSTWYAASFRFNTVTRKNDSFHMHRFLMNPPKGMVVDHRDGDGLNNTRANLRVCTHSENHANCGPTVRNTSGYRGVFFFKRDGTWQAQITHMKRRIHLGYFATKEAAARAYDAKARALHGEYARLNFPEQSHATTPSRSMNETKVLSS